MSPLSKPNIDPSQVFPEVEKLLYRLAWKYASPILDFEETKAEAFLAFVKCCYNYDPSRGTKISTWVYFKVSRRLQGLCKERATDPHLFVEIKDDIAGEAKSVLRDFREMIEGCVEDLSSDAHEILSLIVDTPKELWDADTTPHQLLKRVCAEAGYNRGLDKVALQITLHELKAHFQQLWRISDQVKTIPA